MTSVAALPASPGKGPASTLVMGIVNVTPDSFSDGGRWFDHDAAVAHGVALLEEGAHLLDVGGESTRPGSRRPDEDEELRRVLPVVRELAAAGAVVSVDTMRARVAEACLAAGAVYVNDVSGGLADPDILRVVADHGCPYILMHWRGHGSVMQDLASYEDVSAEVRAELSERVEVALAAGVDEKRLVLDPGLGFAKTAAHNWQLLADLGGLSSLGFPLLIGASRKRFLGALPPGADGDPVEPGRRDAATCAVSVLAAQAGAWAVRVHDVRSSVAAVAVVDAVRGRGDVRRRPTDDR
ncbi:dihydropteroate synthase [Austwickia chelonae]|uniref:Dihydropteroate synthase n=1 Tax=Austwickia chelonae NBRC 105200 TaxID=1184607 RepID=K6V482_9MICO|nr:dihydropteroate synthase [Austwickia chelonae NBRC 105200]SEW32679.1 dihydropteroate synthase [Austwickia chelonae]